MSTGPAEKPNAEAIDRLRHAIYQYEGVDIIDVVANRQLSALAKRMAKNPYNLGSRSATVVMWIMLVHDGKMAEAFIDDLDHHEG